MAPSRSSSKAIKIFRSLLLLSLLESILWSLCLFHSASACGLAYYQRETVRAGAARAARGIPARRFRRSACLRRATRAAQVNLKSTTASPVHPPPPVLDTRALLLALRVRRV
jgi:hypothetical protein